MNRSPNNPPTSPRNGQGNGHIVSKRGLLSIAMLAVSIGALLIAMVGGSKLTMDVFGDNPNSADMMSGGIVVGLAYAVGWLTAMVTIRVYGNLILPMLIRVFTWGCLAAVCYLYIQILYRLYLQQYEIVNFVKYVTVMAGGLGAMVGLHLIIEDHDLRPFSIPLLLISVIQLGLIVYRYTFTEAKSIYLWGDISFFFGMAAFSILMLAHIGLLEPLRKQLTNYFDRNSKGIRTED